MPGLKSDIYYLGLRVFPTYACMLYADHFEHFYLPCLPVDVVNFTEKWVLLYVLGIPSGLI